MKVNHSFASIKIHPVSHNKIMYFKTLQDATDFCQLPCIILWFEGFHSGEATFSKDIDVHKNDNLFIIFFLTVLN